MDLKDCLQNTLNKIHNTDRECEYTMMIVDKEKCIGCGICAGICPCGIWTMLPNEEPIKMYRTYNKK